MAALVVALILRRPIRDALKDRAIGEFSFGAQGFKVVTIERSLQDATKAIAPATASLDDRRPDVVADDRASLLALAEVAPNAAVMEAFRLVEIELRNVVDPERSLRISVQRLARQAVAERWISVAVSEGVDDLARIRNGVSHGDESVTVDQAVRFVDLAIGILIILRSEPPRR